jgi:hypothetical protein
MRRRSRGVVVPWRWLFPLVCLLCLPSCLLIVSTGPTELSDATIVFVAFDDHDARVAMLRITVVDVRGDWRAEGITSRDGSFRCSVPPGVTRVRAAAAAPSGYVLESSGDWPRELAVPSGGSVDVEVRMTALRP